MRLANGRGALSLVAIETYFSDSAAIRAGKRLCKNGETIEVWRGDVCVYREAPAGDAALRWPIPVGRVSG